MYSTSFSGVGRDWANRIRQSTGACKKVYGENLNRRGKKEEKNECNQSQHFNGGNTYLAFLWGFGNSCHVESITNHRDRGIGAILFVAAASFTAYYVAYDILTYLDASDGFTHAVRMPKHTEELNTIHLVAMFTFREVMNNCLIAAVIKSSILGACILGAYGMIIASTPIVATAILTSTGGVIVQIFFSVLNKRKCRDIKADLAHLHTLMEKYSETSEK